MNRKFAADNLIGNSAQERERERESGGGRSTFVMKKKEGRKNMKNASPISNLLQFPVRVSVSSLCFFNYTMGAWFLLFCRRR